MIPETRALLRQNFYRLVNTDETDDDLVDRGETENDVANQCLQYGAWGAQRELIRMGSRRWVTRTSALTWLEGADGLKYVVLPDDFLRMVSDERRSGLYQTSGRRWGSQIDPRVQGDYATGGSGAYWIEGEHLTLGLNSSPPTGLTYVYHARLPEWDDADDDTVITNFPRELLPMIAAEGAYIGMHEGWLNGGMEMESKITRARAYWLNQASRTVKPTDEPQKLRVERPRAPGIFI